MESLRRFIVEHDDRHVFTVAYIGLAVVLSIWISVFWLIVVVAVHLAFEIIRHRHHDHGWWSSIAGAVWEVKLDLALVVFSLVLGVYMDTMLGVAGLSGAARLSANAGRAVGRLAVWERLIRGILLSVDDAANVGRQLGRAVAKKRAARDAAVEGEGAEAATIAPEPPKLPGGTAWMSPWGLGDRMTMGFGILCVVLVVAAPLLSHHDLPHVVAILANDLDPWPEGD